MLRVSFSKLLELVKPMWLTVQLGEGLLTERQINQMLRRAYALMRQCLTAPRRARSCPRAVRRPMKAWPRLLKAQSIKGPMHFQLLQ